MNYLYHQEARAQWEKAHRKALMTQVFGILSRDRTELMDFNVVARRLNLKHAIYRGLEAVEVEMIVGSVGRYQDFTSTFFPKSQDMAERWTNVAQLQLNAASKGWPPIELYKLGKWYFVKDGNHRISVARQLGLEHIDAYVWEYAKPPLNVRDSSDIDQVLLAWERVDFLEHTELDTLRPDHSFTLTVPGGYHQALAQISHYQDVLSQIDDVPVSFADAVTAWYDMIYETTCQRIADMGLMEMFPERTPADFFVWITRHREQLQTAYGQRIPLMKAIHNVRSQYQGPLGWLRRVFKKPAVPTD